MYGTHEDEQLVELWQELQAAQVEGDARRLTSLRAHAVALAQRDDAPREWALLADEAGRFLEQLNQAYVAQPSVGVEGELVELDEESAPEPVARRRGLRLAPLLWVVVLAAYLLFQILSGTGDGR